MKLSLLKTTIATLAGVLLLSSCALGPDYVRPELDLPARFQEATDTGPSIANLKWWEIFNDENLKELIKIALAENKDVLIAAARVEEARAILGITRADLFPRIDGAANATRRDQSEGVFSFRSSPFDDFGVFGRLSWELDIWGKLRRATEADRAQLLATEYAYRSVMMSLISDVARGYFLVLDLDNRLRIARETLENRKGATKLIRDRFAGGIIPELDVNQAEIEEADAAVAVAAFEGEIIVAVNALNVLLGRHYKAIPRGELTDSLLTLTSFPAEVPASLLERRPDVLSAEEQTKAAVALIGVAIANQLPSLSVTGFLGLQNLESGDLFQSSSRTWGISGDLLGPLIDFGKSRYGVRAARARAEQALKGYESAVLNAVEEVDNSITGVRTFKAQYDAYSMQLKAAQNASRLSRARYDEGLSPYLEVLDSDRSLFSAELATSLSRQRYLSAIVQLYKALGGGWDVTEAQEVRAPALAPR
jgi:multidrug efflux system outer membrane protein